MDFHFGSQTFLGVKIPILWGTRAVLAHPSGTLSIIDIGGKAARPEIVSDIPWTDVQYSEKEDGFVIYQDASQIYFYSPKRKLLRDLKGELPECELTTEYTRIGTNRSAIQ